MCLRYFLVLHFLLFASAFCKSLPLAKSSSHASSVMRSISEEYYNATIASLPQHRCNAGNIAVRQEWDSLTQSQRLNYLSAVQCLISKPSHDHASIARSRSEDFIMPHIEQNLHIHFSGLLLPWHRYFLYLYETALREECGYNGYLPYWDWSKYLEDPEKSSIFDGSEYSFSGNGEWIPHGLLNVTTPGGAPPGTYILRPPGTGGGCVQGGPFQNMTLHLDATNDGASTPIRIFERSRCLQRDFYHPILQHRLSYENVTELISQSESIHTLRPTVESRMGIHPGGHEFIGGENLNLFTSPGDPVFFLHHAMLDRVWAIWQSRDPGTRQYALDGTLTSYNYPPSPNATIFDQLNVGSLAPSLLIKHIMSTMEGPLCYVYA